MGAASAFFAVALGAFGAHALKERLLPEMAAIFETGVRYQFYHALGMILCGLLGSLGKAASHAGRLFLAGTIFFSGSLYLLVLTGARWWGAVTPIGGVLFLIGWFVLGRATLRSSR